MPSFTPESMRTLLSAIGAVALSGPGLAQSVVLSDDFETDSAANYILVDDGTPDGATLDSGQDRHSSLFECGERTLEMQDAIPEVRVATTCT